MFGFRVVGLGVSGSKHDTATLDGSDDSVYDLYRDAPLPLTIFARIRCCCCYQKGNSDNWRRNCSWHGRGSSCSSHVIP